MNTNDDGVNISSKKKKKKAKQALGPQSRESSKLSAAKTHFCPPVLSWL